MRVAILHQAVDRGSRPDEADVLDEVEAVAAALDRLRYASETIACTLDLEALRRRLASAAPDVVFNLVESLGGSDSLEHVVPALLDVLGLPYTGSSAETIFLSTQKLLAKERLVACDLPTPDWIEPSGGAREKALSGRFIIKAAAEHASFGLDDGALVEATDEATLREAIQARSNLLGRPCFAERFIDGREIAISILATPQGPLALPPAEIDFSAFPASKPRIVGYRAKWEPESFESIATPRSFRFDDGDGALLAELSRLALRTWQAFRLSGYGRVDFRIDRQGRPWILEVNANPCLSPDAGFQAALDAAGIPFDDAVDGMLGAALARTSMASRPR